MSSSSINTILIEDCLLRLFTEFTFTELFHLRAVCPLWRSLIDSHLLPRRHSLKLFGSKTAVKEYCRTVTSFSSDDQAILMLEDDDLIIEARYFTEAFVRRLAGLLPNLRTLIVCFDGDSPFKELPTLLEQLPGLQWLSLLGQIRYDPIKEFFLLRLAKAIDLMSGLFHLDLLVVNLVRSEHAMQVLVNRLPTVLPRLTSFSLKLFGYRGNVDPLLVQLGPCCTKLRLDSMLFFDGENLGEELMACPTLKSSLQELRITGVGREVLRFVGGYFENLKYLSIGFSGVPEIEALLYEELNTLQHLTELRLENVLLEMNLELASLNSLPAITSLTLTGLDLGRWNFDDYSFLCILGTAFPGLTKLTLRSVNSIDETEMMGAFEFAGECFKTLRAKDVVRERELWNGLAGRHRDV